MGMLDTRKISTIAKLIAAVLLTGGCVRAPKGDADFEAVRAEILAIENQWTTAIVRQAMQLGLHQRNQLIERGRVSAAPVHEKLRDLLRC